MRDFPSCFGENGVQVADSSSSSTNKNAQNLVTCVYQCSLRGRPCLITVSWSKNLMGQVLSVGIDDSSKCLCKVDIKPWLFSKRKGSKSLEAYCTKIDVYWDLSSAKFGSGPEPLEGYYVAVVVDKQMILLLGNLRKEALKRTSASPVPALNAVFVAKKEHILGKKVFGTKAQFCNNGQIHDLVIECDTIGVNDPCLVIRVDGKALMQVKRLKWKFRGNHTIVVDGVDVDVLWDVHNWLFGSTLGNAVFLFKTCVSTEKLWASQRQQPSESNSLSWSYSQRFSDSKGLGLGFSLILYALKTE